jgi:hypothetical protein
MGTTFHNDKYNYDQFVNQVFEHFECLRRKLGGPTGMFSLAKAHPSSNHMVRNCLKCKLK